MPESGTSYKTDHCGICESVSGQYVTAIEGNTSNGNTGSQSNGDGVYRRKRKLSLVLGAYRPKYEDYRAQLQKRAGVGGQDDGLPCGVQVRQRPDPQTRRRDGLTDQAQNTRTVNREESLPKTAPL